MTTGALVALAVAFLALLAAFAIRFTRTHPPEKEDPWPSESQTPATRRTD